MKDNPFYASGCVSVTDRLDSVNRFNKQKLEQALKVPGLQPTVEKRIRSRLKQLEKKND